MIGYDSNGKCEDCEREKQIETKETLEKSLSYPEMLDSLKLVVNSLIGLSKEERSRVITAVLSVFGDA